MALRLTVMTCTTMVGFTIPVPRNADPIDTSANCIARFGRNQRTYSTPARMVASSAPNVCMYGLAAA